MFAKYISNNIDIFGLDNKNYKMTLDDIKGSPFEMKIVRHKNLSSSIIHKFKTDNCNSMCDNISSIHNNRPSFIILDRVKNKKNPSGYSHH